MLNPHPEKQCIRLQFLQKPTPASRSTGGGSNQRSLRQCVNASIRRYQIPGRYVIPRGEPGLENWFCFFLCHKKSVDLPLSTSLLLLPPPLLLLIAPPSAYRSSSIKTLLLRCWCRHWKTSTMTGRRGPSSDSSNVALVAAAGALAAISSMGLLLLFTSRDRRNRFQDSKELYIPSRYTDHSFCFQLQVVSIFFDVDASRAAATSYL